MIMKRKRYKIIEDLGNFFYNNTRERPPLGLEIKNIEEKIKFINFRRLDIKHMVQTLFLFFSVSHFR
jgi:hypothetical protein